MIFLLLLLILTSASAQTVRDHDITIDDYFTQSYATDCAISPDGEWIAYTEIRWEGEDEDRNSDIWVVNTATKETQRLTFDKASDANPVWSADSKWIYFTSNPKQSDSAAVPYNGKKQLWRMRADGSELAAVTRIEKGIGQFELSANGKAVYYTLRREGLEDEWKDLRNEFKKLKYGDGKNEYTELWKLDLVSWRAEKIYDEDRNIRSFTVTDDEQKIALITSPTEHLIDNEGETTVDIWFASDKKITSLPDELWREQAFSPFGWLDGLTWSGDGKKLAFRVTWDGYPAELYVAHFSGDKAEMSKLTRDNEYSLGDATNMTFRGNSYDLCLTAIRNAKARVACIKNITKNGQGKTDYLSPADGVVDKFSLTPDGRTVAITMGTVSHPEEVFLSKGGSFERITNINPQMATWKLPQISSFKWRAPDGAEVEGILELPPDYVPGKPLPTLVSIHGGPTSCDYLAWRYWIYGRGLWPAQGWAVLSPNYRGSTGYGDKFMVDLIGRENDIEVQDILSGVDALVEAGIADPEKLAVGGWSNGGYLTNCVITHTDRFKAASSGAGVLDMGIQWGIEDTPGHVINYMEGLPWEQADAYRKASPFWNMDKIKTPTIIHVGEGDERVPVAHSKALHRALHEYLDVPTELIVYPGQGHGLTKYNYRKAKLEWDNAWFNRYVLGEESAAPAPAIAAP